MRPLRAFGEVIQVVWRHAWRMMILRHRGEGLNWVTTRTRLALVVLGGLTATLCTFLAPADGRVRAAVVSLAMYAVVTFLVSRGPGGALRMTGLAALVAGTEPIGLALRWTPGLAALDQGLSFWFIVACSVFFFRAEARGSST